MHITNVTEITTAQGSEKRVILYEAPQKANESKAPSVIDHPARKVNMAVITDNVIVQPKQYQMEVIIPDSLIGPYHKQGLSRLSALIEYMQRTDESNGGLDWIGSKMQYIWTTLDVMEAASDVLDTVLGAFGSSSQMETMNKNSLEAMVGNGRVIVFKKWTGFDYGYGIITKMEVTKRPTEEGVFRGSITFQETPILNISTKTLGVKKSMPETIVEYASYGAMQAARIANLALAYPFIKMTGVMDEAGAPGTDGPAEPFEFTGGDIFKGF